VKVGVIGAGVMGCAAAAAFARRGADVQLFEREVIGAPASSSMGPSRIIRLTYDEVDYVRLAQQAFVAWRMLEAETRQSLLIETCGIDIADRGDASLDTIANALTLAEVEFELWDDRDLKWAYPQFRSDGLRALFQAKTAVLLADRCVAALAAVAIDHGTLVHERTEVREIEPGTGGVTVRTASQSHIFDRVVVSAGPRIGPLLRGTGIQLPVTVSMEQSVYFGAGENASFRPPRFPICIGRFGERGLTSIFPAVGGHGVKMMIENKTAAADPEDFAVYQAAVEQVAERARILLPSLDQAVSRVDRARYTILPDEDFLIDRHPTNSEIIICSACSGHGFKFAPIVGEMLADLADGGEAHPRFRLHPERFDVHGSRA
jgi:sarcosine oxidase